MKQELVTGIRRLLGKFQVIEDSTVGGLAGRATSLGFVDCLGLRMREARTRCSWFVIGMMMENEDIWVRPQGGRVLD